MLYGLSSLKKLELGRFSSSSFLGSRFPPNLAHLSIRHLTPSLYQLEPEEFGDALETISEFMASAQVTMRLDISFDVDRLGGNDSSPSFSEFPLYGAELRFWKTVRGFGIKGSPSQVEDFERWVRLLLRMLGS